MFAKVVAYLLELEARGISLHVEGMRASLTKSSYRIWFATSRVVSLCLSLSLLGLHLSLALSHVTEIVKN